MSDAVLDAGPLVHLSELGALDVLHDLSPLRVPDSVWAEVTRHQRRAFESPELNLQRITSPPPSAELAALARAFGLDQGEIESLSLMETHPSALFLTDDAAARLVAEQRGYRVHGAIGLLIRSVRRGNRQPKEILGLLRAVPDRSSLFIRPQLLAEIIRQLETEWVKTR